MVFENNDDFGISVFRNDVWESVASKNVVKVGLIKRSEKISETLQGDFLGVQENVYQETVKDIYININAFSPLTMRLKKQGYDSRGDLKFNCYAKYDVDVLGDDLIVFFDDYHNGINAGYVFRVEMKDAGMYQGQYCWKEFEIILTKKDGWEYKSQENIIVLNGLISDINELSEEDYTIESWANITTALYLQDRTNPEVLKKIEQLQLAIDSLVEIEE